MNVNFKIAAGFGYYLSDIEHYIRGTDCDVNEGATVEDLLEDIAFPRKAAMHIFVNGRIGEKATKLREGDQVYLGLTTAGG